MNTPIFLMIVGGVIFLVAFMGCCGAWKESKCLIYTYAFFLAIILVAQVMIKRNNPYYSGTSKYSMIKTL